MELFKFTGTNTVQHWVNPLKIVRVTLTPEMTTEVIPPLPPLPGEPIPAPVFVTTPMSLVVHLDDGFAIQVPDDVATLVDKLDKVG